MECAGYGFLIISASDSDETMRSCAAVRSIRIMAEGPTDILADAIARNSATVLSLPTAGMLRNHKSRFLNETPDGLWLESVATEQALIEHLISIGQPCAVSFKTGDQKICFVSKVLKAELEYQLNAETKVSAVLLARPAQLKPMQRRNSYRVPITASSELQVKLWRIGEKAELKDKPISAAGIGVEVKDLSVGGLGVALLPKDGKPPMVQPDERLRVWLQLKDGNEILMQGRGEGPAEGAAPNTVECGIQFDGMQDGLEGRQALSELTKVVGALHLIEVRRARMGMS